MKTEMNKTLESTRKQKAKEFVSQKAKEFANQKAKEFASKKRRSSLFVIGFMKENEEYP